MQFGAARPRRQIDINVIPHEFRRRHFPILTAGLSLVLVGCLLLLYGVFYLKSYADLEIVAFRSRIPIAQEAVRAATAAEEALNQERQRYASQRSDHRVLSERQVLWSKVLQAVSAPPAGVRVREIGQAGYTVSVIGSAPEFAQAVKFLESLRATDLFSNSSIELIDSSLLASTATPRASYGTPTATRPAGVAPLLPTQAATPTAVVTRTPTGTPTPTRTPNAAATSTARAQWTATAKAQGTAQAKARATQTAYARIANRPTATATRTPTATPITRMVLRIAEAEATEVGNTKSPEGNGPAQAVDDNPSTGWAPAPLTGNSGRWLRIDLRDSTWFTPGTDVIWSVKIIPYRLLVSGSLPAASTGRYYVYTYDTSGNRTQRCDRTNVNWAQSQADTCWSATANRNVPLTKVAVLDIGIPSNSPTDANWHQGIAEVVIEVNQRPPGVAVVPASGPAGLGPDEAPGTPTAFPSPSRTVQPTSTALRVVGTSTPVATSFAIPTPPRPTPAFGQLPTPIVTATPAAAQGPVDFLILLEVKPGEGY